MPIITDGPMMEPANKGIDEFHVGMGTSLGASVNEALSDLPVAQLYRGLTTPTGDSSVQDAMPQTDALGNALGNNGPAIAEETKPAAPRMDIIEANDRVKKAGLAPHLTLPNQPDIAPAQLQIMMDRAQARHERETTIERGPQGFIPSTLSVGTSFLVGAVDPINVASAFIPVMGEMRYGKMLASAGEGFASRMAVRGAVGAAEGAVGQAALEPLDWWSHTQDGRDFGMSDVLQSVMFGAVLGGALHAGGGAVGDKLRQRRGEAVYPFGPGEQFEGVSGTHVPAALLHEDGITPDALEQHFTGETPHPSEHEPIYPEAPDNPLTASEATAQIDAARPAIPSPEIQTIDDLPRRAHEDAMRGAIASLIEGEPLRVGEMLEAAAKTDPRIAESFEAYHGSPYDFDSFSLDKSLSPKDAINFTRDVEIARHYASDDGTIYSVRIHTDPEHILHWNKPLNEQSKFVQEALSPLGPFSAGQVGENLFGVRNAKLRDLGIKGVEHDGEGGQIIVFNEKDIEITHKNGDPVKGEQTLAGRHADDMVRLYHGGSDPTSGGARWVTPHEEYARDFRAMGSPNEVHYVDVPKSELLKNPSHFDEINNRPINFEAPESMAKQLRPLDANASKVSNVVPFSVGSALDRDTAWRALSQTAPEFNEPDVVAASNAAAKVPLPPTRLDERVSASEKADAFAKQMYDMFADRMPPEDRQRLDDLIKRIDDDHEAREIAIVRSGSCLFGVI